MKLWRPVGLGEMRLIHEAAHRMFPPRLSEQPLFYPILNRPYAEQIARDWNAKSEPFAGYVTEFDLRGDYAAGLERHVVGRKEHEELWVPAGSLPEFNRQIVGLIEVVQAYFSPRFRGHVPNGYGLQGKDARDQLQALSRTRGYSLMDFDLELQANSLAVYLNFPFWAAAVTADEDLGVEPHELQATLLAVERAWRGPTRLVREASLIVMGDERGT